MEMLGRYEQTTALSNMDAGSCRWCFAVYNGREYFIKEYLEPKHPETDTISAPEKVAKKLRKCYAFEQEKIKLFRAINEQSDGNAVRVEDFFRIGAKYYMAMPRIHAVKMEETDIANLWLEDKQRICAVIAHALACIHDSGFVHSDIKHNNIIFTKTGRGQLTAKLIDYDAGFFEASPPNNPEQLAGDQVTYAPEVFNAIMGGEMHITRKADIFSLGVLFHQYYAGELPGFDQEQAGFVGEAVLYGGEATVSLRMPPRIRELIQRMLAADPDQRPTARQVHRVLIGQEEPCPADVCPPVPDPVPVPEPIPAPTPEPVPASWGDAPGRHAWSGLGDL